MQPKTKLQVRVFELSTKLPALTVAQKGWAFKNCLEHIAYRTKHKTTCLDCGAFWPSDHSKKKSICPSCNIKVSIEDTRQKITRQRSFVSLIQIKEGFQVIRIFDISSYYKSGLKADLSIKEVVQQWFTPQGKFELIARNRAWGWYSDNFTGALEIRNRNAIDTKFDIHSIKIFPGMKTIPELQRNGFNGDFHKFTPYRLFHALLSSNNAETLYKIGQMQLFEMWVGVLRNEIDRHFSTLKLAIRKGYKPKNYRDWFDYLDLLSYFGKDLKSPKYIFLPEKELKKEHNRLVAKKTIIEKKLALERKANEAKYEQEAYAKSKGKFFGLEFTRGNLIIKVLEQVTEFVEEANIHKHCLFSNDYHKKKHSLIFSARVDGVSVETIEISLPGVKIIQSRGYGNQASKYNQQILELLTENLHLIQERQKRSKNFKKQAA